MRIYTLGLNHSKRLFQHILSHISIYIPTIRPKPTLIVIGITNACNLKCSFCFQGEKDAHKLDKRGERFMTIETFKKVLLQAKELSNFIEFGLFGEPLLHPELATFIKIAKDEGFHLTIDSNATLYSKEIAETIVNNKVNSVVFSIDGINSKEYEAARVGATFESVKKSIDLIKESKEEKRAKLPLLIARGLELKKNTQQKHKAWMNNLGFQHILFSPLQNWSGLFSKTPSSKSSCTFPWLIMSIDSDGEILPCCEDYNATISMGNIKKDTLKSIWNSKQWNKLRSYHRDKDQNCGSFETCNNCSYLQNQTLPWPVRFQLYSRALKEFTLELFN